MQYHTRSNDPHDQPGLTLYSRNKLLMSSAVMARRTSAANDEVARPDSSTIARTGGYQALHWITAEWPADELRTCLFANENASSH